MSEFLSPHDLFWRAAPPTPELGARSHYVANALRYGLVNYRHLTLGSVFSDVHRLPRFVTEFLAARGEAIAVGNVIDGIVRSLVLRAVTSKDFVLYGSGRAFPYGYGMLPPTFVYGTPVVLVEGVLDRDAILPHVPTAMALLSNGLSKMQIEVLEVLTKSAVLLYDADQRGREGAKRDERWLQRRGWRSVIAVDLPPGMKDPGVLAEMEFRRHPRRSALVEDLLLRLDAYGVVV